MSGMEKFKIAKYQQAMDYFYNRITEKKERIAENRSSVAMSAIAKSQMGISNAKTRSIVSRLAINL